MESGRKSRRRASVTKRSPRPHPGFIPLGALLPVIAGPPDPAAGPPCHLCSALCCKYFALEIDKPVTPKEHDEVRWYLLHQNVVVWAQDGEWYLEVRNVCQHLQADKSCGIYETRPQICRDYGLPEAGKENEGACEFFTQDVPYDLFFDSAARFEEWSSAQLAAREGRLARRREKKREQPAVAAEATRS